MNNISKTILLVEDEPIAAMAKQRSLLKIGYKVIISDSGEKAISKIEESGSSIDLILMDIELGSGIDGIASAELILKNNNIPVIFLTAHTGDEIIKRIEEITSYGYVPKSADISILDAAIRIAFKLYNAYQSISQREKTISALAAIVENSDNIIVHKDLNCRVVAANPAFAKAAGFKSPQNMTGKTDAEIFNVSPDSEPVKTYIADELKAQTLPRGEFISREEPVVQPDSSIRYVHTKKFPVYGADDVLIGTGNISVDITERKLENESLRKLSRAIEQTPVSIVITDLNGNIEYVNPKFTELTGYTFDEVKGENPRILKSDKNPPEEYKRLWETITKGGTWTGEFCNIKKDGEIYWESASISPVFNDEDIITHFVAVKEDITFRKEAEARLKELGKQKEQLMLELQHEKDLLEKSAKHFRNLIENSADLITILSDDGIILYQSPSVKHVLGYDEPEMIGENISSYVHKEDITIFSDKLKNTPADQYLIEMEFNIQKKDYTWIILESKIRLVKDLHNSGFTIIINSRDVTDNRNLMEEIIQSKNIAEASNKSKSIFLANMSHELKTPLNSLLGYCRLLEMQKAGPLNPKQLEFLTIMLDSGNHLLDIITDILDISSIEAGKITLERKKIFITDFIKRFRESIRIIAEKKGVDIIFDIDPDAGILYADQIRLKQILYNLLSNAIKFTDSGKKTGLEIKGKNEYIEIRVWDEGCGIPDESLEKIFQPFEQVRNESSVKNQGTGLGLSITKKLVNLHDGEINVESVCGKGSTFIVLLPGRTPPQ